MSVKKFFAAAKKLPFEERVELAHRLWDEFMDGCQDWKAPPIPKGKFPWKTLKAEIDAKSNRTDRLELLPLCFSSMPSRRWFSRSTFFIAFSTKLLPFLARSKACSAAFRYIASTISDKCAVIGGMLSGSSIFCSWRIRHSSFGIFLTAPAVHQKFSG
ncbi:MAG: hypothetical protein ACLQAH_02175 [Limisphaerales bacterium]